ncbi:MAG: acetyltransferase [Candidatus Eisenbacteria bacterium]|uniref:Acetyltransferase n=1 Tax=Eiseniibacteriota bacterium TaxID=2212470 RepID=A0A538UAX4_UNCEI|nr:MAG: acetyltransferase [Candidatus Eisenbacteria bacterium]
MPRLVVWGASGHAKVVADIVRLQGDHEIIGFLDDRDPSAAGRPFCGSSVLGGRERLPALREEGVTHVLFGFGDGAARLRLGVLVRDLGFALATAVHPRAVVAGDVGIGPGSVVAAGAVVGPGAVIGENVIVNTLAGIDHDCVVERGAHVCPGARLGGFVVVKETAWVGLGTTVRDRVTIGRGTVVGAGSLVLRDLPDGVVAYGTPAAIARTVET